MGGKTQFLSELGWASCVLLVFALLDILIWFISAYSLISSLSLIVLLHLLVLAPAILLPFVWKGLNLWIQKRRSIGMFHKYDWNVMWSLTAIISSVVVLLLVLYSTPLWFRWMNEPHFVDRDVNYEDVNRKVLFVFNKEWHVNMTMLGYKRSVPVGDPTNQPEYWDCFAPILPVDSLEPNIFWALCSGLKQNCSESIDKEVACFQRWMNSDIKSGLAVSQDIEFLIRKEITDIGKKYGLPTPPPKYLVLTWDDLGKTYSNAQLALILTVSIGYGLIIVWICLRRCVLSMLCGPFDHRYIAIS